MKRQNYLVILFIFATLTLSSFYLAWSVQHGLGEIEVESKLTQGTDGERAAFILMRTRMEADVRQLDLVLAIPAIGSSGENLRLVGMELARRNFTVAIVDLSSLSPQESHTEEVTQQAVGLCVRVLTVLENDTLVNEDHLGILAYGSGASVAQALIREEIDTPPLGTVIIGPLTEVSRLDTSTLNNTLVVGGECYGPTRTAFYDLLRDVTGNQSAVPGVTYGDFDNGTAIMLGISWAPGDAAPESNIGLILSVDWLVKSVQGEAQWNHTLRPWLIVAHGAVVARWTGTLGILGSVACVVVILSKPTQHGAENRTHHAEEPDAGAEETPLARVFGMIIIPAALSQLGLYIPALLLAWLTDSIWILPALAVVAAGLCLSGVLSVTALRVVSGEGLATHVEPTFGLATVRRNMRAIVRALVVAAVTAVGMLLLANVDDILGVNPGVTYSLIDGVAALWPALIVSIFALAPRASDAAWLRRIESVNEDERSWTSRVFVGSAAFLRVFVAAIVALALYTSLIDLMSLSPAGALLRPVMIAGVVAEAFSILSSPIAREERVDAIAVLVSTAAVTGILLASALLV